MIGKVRITSSGYDPDGPMPHDPTLEGWMPIDTAPEGVEVMTKIHDADGCRNEQSLKRQGRLWFFPDMTMYVYYQPTHWRHLAPTTTGPH